jgi:hypothetical protein
MDADGAGILSRLASIIRFDIVCLPGIAILGFSHGKKIEERTAMNALISDQKRDYKYFKDLTTEMKWWNLHRHEINKKTAIAKTWNDDEIAEVVHWFVFDADISIRGAGGYDQILCALGDRTHPVVLGILGDYSLNDQLRQSTKHGDSQPESPFNKACLLLGDLPPIEAATLVLPFLEDPLEEIRKDAAYVIAATGISTMIPCVSKTLQHSSRMVYDRVLSGILAALRADRLDTHCAETLFPGALRLFEQGNGDCTVIDILLIIDKKRALESFLSPSVFSLNFPIVYDVIKTLANNNITIPRERLLTLIEGIDAHELQYPKTYALGEALQLLGQYRIPDDRKLMASYLDHVNNQIAEGATSGLLCSHGLGESTYDIFCHLLDIEEKHGYAVLNPCQRYYYAVHSCEDEINNGGLGQYFMNSSGEHWRDALAGFEALGSTEKLGILKEAIALFGRLNPSRYRKIRLLQLCKVFWHNDNIFEPLNDRYFASQENCDVLLTRFVLAHPDDFR